MKKVYQVIPYDGYDQDTRNIKTFINEKDALNYKRYLELDNSMYSDYDVDLKEIELIDSFDEKHFEEKIHYCNIAYVFNENLHKFILEYFKLESCTLTEFEKINRLEYKGSNMGIYRGLKDVIYMNIPCNIYSPSDNLEQQSYYKLSLILDEYKRILKEEQEINMGNELVIFKDCLQKAVKKIASTL